MAIVEIFIPDGEFCSDNTTLGCLFEEHEFGTHWCGLYHKPIGKLQDIYVNGEHKRAFRKCDSCRKKMIRDGGNGMVEDEI